MVNNWLVTYLGFWTIVHCTGHDNNWLNQCAGRCFDCLRQLVPSGSYTLTARKTFLRGEVSGQRRGVTTSCKSRDKTTAENYSSAQQKMCHDVTYDFLAIRLATLNCSTLLQALARVLLFSGLSLTFSNHLSRTENILSLGDRGGWRWLISVHTCVLW